MEFNPTKNHYANEEKQHQQDKLVDYANAIREAVDLINEIHVYIRDDLKDEMLAEIISNKMNNSDFQKTLLKLSPKI